MTVVPQPRIQSVAELKRRLRPGTLVTTHYHRDPFGRGDPPARRVVARNTVELRFEACDWSRGKESHLRWPKATEVLFLDNGSFVFDPGTAVERTYTIVDQVGGAV